MGHMQRMPAGITHATFHPGNVAQDQVRLEMRWLALQQGFECDSGSDWLTVGQITLRAIPMAVSAHRVLSGVAARLDVPVILVSRDCRA
jgi:hypothetical protein